MKNKGKSLRGQPLEVPEGGLWLSLAVPLYSLWRRTNHEYGFSSRHLELQLFTITCSTKCRSCCCFLGLLVFDSHQCKGCC